MAGGVVKGGRIASERERVIGQSPGGRSNGGAAIAIVDAPNV